ILASCGPSNEFVAPPPPEVTVSEPEVRDVITYLEFPGRTEGVASVDIRARVAGFLKERLFRPGEYVEKGDALFIIEQEPFQAAVASAQAALDAARADAVIAETELGRKKKAAESNAIAKVEVERAVADLDAARAAVKGAEAVLHDAEISLSYTDIRAPIAGRVSLDLVDLGNLVGAGEATLLTTVVNDDPLYAYFEVNERQILPFLGSRPTAEHDQIKRSGNILPLKLRLSDGTVYEGDGEIDFVDNRVDAATGTVRVRAVFPNSGNQLAAGLFVRVMLPEKVPMAVMVPRHAIQRDLAGDFVLVADAENIVRHRNVTPGAVVDDLRIVTEGLEAGERVIVEGLQRAREGLAVKPLTAQQEGEQEGGASSPPADASAKKPTDAPAATEVPANAAAKK
ncbi:MAG: efflux RND transporter periplasmic adaptor subunit, partial [Verrucomicrobiales bacterium]